MQVPHEKIADVATAGSVVGAGISLADVNSIVGILAGIAAIVSVCVSIYYHRKRNSHE